MASVPYDIKQGQTMHISNPMLCAAIGGDNPTPFYLFIRQLPPGLQWVFPYTYGFMFPIEPPQQVFIDASQVPPGYPPAPASMAQALLTAWNTPQPYSAGTRAAATPQASQSSVTAQVTGVGSVAIPVGGSAIIGFEYAMPSSGIALNTAYVFEGTTDDVNWNPAWIFDISFIDLNPVTAAWRYGSDAGFFNSPLVIQYFIASSGYSQVRMRVTAWGAGQNPFNVTFRASPGSALSSPVGQQRMLRSAPVTIASDQTSIPVSIPGTVDVSDRAARLLGHVNVDNAIDISDRTSRFLGHVSALSIENLQVLVKIAPINLQLAANAAALLVGGVAGQTIFPLELNVSVETVATALIQLQDAVSGTVFANIRTDAIMSQPHPLRGVAVGTGNGVQLKNTSGVVSGTISGELVYIQT